MQTRQLPDCLLPVFSLKGKRFILRIGASLFFAWATLVKVSWGGISFPGAVPVFSLAVTLRLVEGTKRF